MPNTLYDALFAPHHGNSAAFLIGDDGKTLTYDDFLRRVSRMAHALTEAGVRPGDRIAVQAPKTVQGVVLYAATIQIGAVYLPLNTAYTTTEVDYFVTDATPVLLVCATASLPALAPLAAKVGAAVLTLDADNTGTLTDATKGQPDTFATVPRATADLAALLYTSGTTGRSKGAMLTHDNLLSNAQALVDLWQNTAADRLIHALPVFHTHGLFVALNTALLAGASVRFMTRFDPDAIIAELPQSTLMMGVPTFYTRLLDDPRLSRDTCANMRLFISGSAPLLAETHAAFADRTGHMILERYGMTETNMITSNPCDGPRIAGTVGLPLPGVAVRLTDAQDGIGMVTVRGPNVFAGYWNMPEKTAEDLRPDGWFSTGDLGRIDAQGYLEIVGRNKDLIISGGYNIYPKEIEDALNACPGVQESAVFGVPDADMGEAVVAVVVMQPGQVFDAAALGADIGATLARFKLPRRIAAVDALPRNAMGKVQKNLLRADWATG